MNQDEAIKNMQMNQGCKPRGSVAEPEVAEKDGSSSEIDIQRLVSRYASYKEAVSEYVRYFNDNGMLLTVDVSCGDVLAVWEAVRNYLSLEGLGVPSRGVEQVILFRLSKFECFYNKLVKTMRTNNLFKLKLI